MLEREKIIEQSTEMFYEHGVKSIRMDDIAKELGISKRTLYEQFADKDELLLLSVKHLLSSQIKEICEKVCNFGNTFESLITGFQMMFDHSEARYKLISELRRFYPKIFAQVCEWYSRTGYDEVHNMLLSFQEKGLVSKGVNADLSAIVFFYTARMFEPRNNIFLPEGVDRKSAFLYTIVNFFRGLATEEGMREIDRLIEEKKLYDL